MATQKIVQQMLGEAADVSDPDTRAQDAAGAVPAEEKGSDLTPGESAPVETLLALWEKGAKQETAVRVLDALDSYRQFIELCFRIGQAGASELGSIMDELTSEEKSEHDYDTIPDDDLAAKFAAGHGPRSGPDTHRATGESLGRRIAGQV